MELEFKMLEEFIDRLRILYLNTLNTYRVQTAYFFENWTSVASALFYVATMLLFVKILYSNVKTFAGYTENEMLLLLFVGQVAFYFEWLWSVNNILGLVFLVRSGELDLVLAKPVPSLFFVTFNKISLLNRLKEAVPNLLLVGILIDWGQLQTSVYKAVMGIVIFICGQIAWHCFRFLFALPVFFLGQAEQLFYLTDNLGYTHNIPYEGFSGSLKTVFTVLIPSLMLSAVSVSVVLGKSNPILMLVTSIAVASIFLVLKQVGWKKALQNYSSASS